MGDAVHALRLPGDDAMRGGTLGLVLRQENLVDRLRERSESAPRLFLYSRDERDMRRDEITGIGDTERGVGGEEKASWFIPVHTASNLTASLRVAILSMCVYPPPPP